MVLDVRGALVEHGVGDVALVAEHEARVDGEGVVA